MASMYEEDMTEEQLAARKRIHALLQELSKEIGPAGMMQYAQADEEERLPDAIDGEVFLTEWVVVMSWIDAEQGHGSITCMPSENLLQHHKQGLLAAALDD